MSGQVTVPHVSIVVDPKNIYEEAVVIVKSLRPEWLDSDLWVTPLTDGLTNQVVGCFLPTKSHDIALVRVYGENSELFIDRDQEVHNLMLLSEASFCPPIYGTFENGICYGFKPGYALEPEMLKNPVVSRKIAEKMAQLHAVTAKSKPAECPTLFEMMHKFYALCPNLEELSSWETSLRGLTKQDLAKEIQNMETTIKALNLTTVFAHNDLLAENILFNEETKSVSFIDYEYAGYSYQAYDIANHFNEFAGKVSKPLDFSCCPDQSFQLNWLNQYLKAYKIHTGQRSFGSNLAAEVDELYDQVQLFTLYSHLFWSIWALAEAVHSSHNFDYFQFGQKRLERYFQTKDAILSKRGNTSCSLE